MIHIDPVEPENDERWTKWREAAKQATLKLKQEGGAAPINEKLYKECRDLILAWFHGKCAYCETKVTAGMREGDVEHFRPKKRVTDEKWEIVYVDDQKQVKHPGYYWLAYDWRNLFPSCISCNQVSSSADGSRVGKVDRFPVKGKRAMQPDDPLTSENPLLIDPYVDDPAEHFTFSPETGIIGGKTERGKLTIEILGLNREGLIEDRKSTAEAAGDDYTEYVEATMKKNEAERERRRTKFQAYEKGEAPYSAFGKEMIRLIRERTLAALGLSG